MQAAAEAAGRRRPRARLPSSRAGPPVGAGSHRRAVRRRRGRACRRCRRRHGGVLGLACRVALGSVGTTAAGVGRSLVEATGFVRHGRLPQQPGWAAFRRRRSHGRAGRRGSGRAAAPSGPREDGLPGQPGGPPVGAGGPAAGAGRRRRGWACRRCRPCGRWCARARVSGGGGVGGHHRCGSGSVLGGGHPVREARRLPGPPAGVAVPPPGRPPSTWPGAAGVGRANGRGLGRGASGGGAAVGGPPPWKWVRPWRASPVRAAAVTYRGAASARPSAVRTDASRTRPPPP
ncbi:hypothetical protein SCNRRL3882_5764 [Streptomyces chartreusis NRRL 3882]|uniref:Uncharacterized protein n=1 Tax=Streptomyces chartreusis NRRL 3882 TaxID=1079985 RepID=A0A2N9BG37_STRCX|nr:hypothetical protein SCNRRL3882_5764 [Streptomyces chartreusis NRRL 3882]